MQGSRPRREPPGRRGARARHAIRESARSGVRPTVGATRRGRHASCFRGARIRGTCARRPAPSPRRTSPGTSAACSRDPVDDLAVARGAERLDTAWETVARLERVGDDARPARDRGTHRGRRPDAGAVPLDERCGAARVPEDRDEDVHPLAGDLAVEGAEERRGVLGRDERVDEHDAVLRLAVDGADVLLPLLVVGPSSAQRRARDLDDVHGADLRRGPRCRSHRSNPSGADVAYGRSRATEGGTRSRSIAPWGHALLLAVGISPPPRCAGSPAAGAGTRKPRRPRRRTPSCHATRRSEYARRQRRPWLRDQPVGRGRGRRVTTLPAGTYTIDVNDQSSMHNFHLTGPGVDEATDVGGRRVETSRSTSRPGRTRSSATRTRAR